MTYIFNILQSYNICLFCVASLICFLLLYIIPATKGGLSEILNGFLVQIIPYQFHTTSSDSGWTGQGIVIPTLITIFNFAGYLSAQFLNMITLSSELCQCGRVTATFRKMSKKHIYDLNYYTFPFYPYEILNYSFNFIHLVLEL